MYKVLWAHNFLFASMRRLCAVVLAAMARAGGIRSGAALGLQAQVYRVVDLWKR